MTDATAYDGAPGPPDAPPVEPPPRAPPPTTPPERTLDDQVRALVSERGYDPAVALELAATWKCEECACAIGATRKDDCECPCHCDCCCVDFLRYHTGCDCECPKQCHYEPITTSSDEDESKTESDSEDLDPENREPARPLDQPEPTGNGTEGSKQEAQKDEGDASMPTATERPISAWNIGQLYEKVTQTLSAMKDEGTEADENLYVHAFFSRLYKEAQQTGMKPKKESDLPNLSSQETALLAEYMRILVEKQYTLQKIKAAIMEVVRTSYRSTWSLERILNDRKMSASAPPSTGRNAWSQKTPTTNQATLEADMAMFRFDPTVYATDEIKRLKKLCSESYSFADSTRKPVSDEWTIIMGIMSGSIAVRALPQFLKRCCNMMQFQWFHYQMIRRAEGELYAPLPPNVKIFDYNQTSKRLADTILAGPSTQGLDPTPIQRMLAATKTISYNDDLKTIHFFFDTKQDAINWEGMSIPLRRLSLALKNPDARYREIQETPTGERKVVIRPPKDGLEDNRYDSHYKLRLTNITRTMEVDKLAKFLKELTNDDIIMGSPIDAYGANSEYSLTWDFLARTHVCPPALAKVNRIMWRDHAILILHQGRAAAVPCHQCAEIGHQASVCPKKKPEDWFSESTIIVTDATINTLTTDRRTWTTTDEARQLFEALGDMMTATEPPTNEQNQDQTPTKTIPNNTSTPSPEQTETPTKTPQTQRSETTPEKRTDAATKPSTKTPQNDTSKHATTQPDDNSNEAAATTKTPISTEWITAMTRFSGREKPQLQQTTKNKEEHTPALKTNKSSNKSGSRFEALSNTNQQSRTQNPGPQNLFKTNKRAEHEDKSEAPTGTVTTDKDRANAEARRETRRKQTEAVKHLEEHDALAEAIDRANMERVDMTIIRKAEHHRLAMDKAGCLAAIDNALKDKSRIKSSRNGTIEAINGTLVNTPATGNGLYQAIAEGLRQTTFAAKKHQAALTELTMLTKFLIYLANNVDADVEFEQANALAFLEIPASETEGLAVSEIMAKVAAHYAEIALSASAPKAIITEHLWGHTDCIQLISKGLRRAIFVICSTNDPNVAHHVMFQPQRIKDNKSTPTVPSAALHQLSYREWLQEIRKEVENNVPPIVISHTTNHYNAVLLHHNETLTHRKIPNKTQKLTDLWGPAVVPVPPTGSPHTDPNDPVALEEGPTRVQLIQSQSSVHEADVFRALSQDNWTWEEKKHAIDALVSGTGRLKEMLVFTVDEAMPDEKEEDEQTAYQSADGATQESDSTFVPSGSSPRSSLITPTQDSTGSESPGTEQHTEPRAAYELPDVPTQYVYTDWVQMHWDRIVADWAGQGGIHPPRLGEKTAMKKFAATYPEVMTELSRQHPNPITVLEHLTDEGLRGWLAQKRIRYCVDELIQVIATIEHEPARQALTQWILDVRATTLFEERLAKYRNADMWKLLRGQAQVRLTGRPLLTMKFMKDCLCVLAMEELFPTLAQEILLMDGMEHQDYVSLGQIYETGGPFQAATAKAAAAESWQPLLEFVRNVGIHLSQVASQGEGPPRC